MTYNMSSGTLNPTHSHSYIHIARYYISALTELLVNRC